MIGADRTRFRTAPPRKLIDWSVNVLEIVPHRFPAGAGSLLSSAGAAPALPSVDALYPVSSMLVFAISNGEVILIIVLAAIPIAALSFALSGEAFKQIGKGSFSVQFEHDLPQGVRDSDAEASAAVRDAEIRQLLEAKAYRQSARGERPLDVEAELERILLEDRESAEPGDDAQLREEVRQLVVARNERRARKGEKPLDVEAEIERQLRDLENLGQ